MSEEFVAANIIPFTVVRRARSSLPLSARESAVTQMRAIEAAWVRTIDLLGGGGTLEQAKARVREAAALIVAHLEALPAEPEEDVA